jgi:mRNA interferase RelE/StbE
MRYQIDFVPAARRQFQKLSRDLQERLARTIDGLADNPRPHGAIKLEGAEDAYRIRVGDYRIIYEIRDTVLTVLIVRVGHRREVYR